MEILQTKRLGHLALVMGTLKKFGLIELIDQNLTSDHQHRVSTGKTVAVILMLAAEVTRMPRVVIHLTCQAKPSFPRRREASHKKRSYLCIQRPQ